MAAAVRDWLGLRAALAFKLSPDTSERGQRSIMIEREPHHVLLLRFWIRLGSVFREAVGRDKAAVLRFQPETPVR